ncbi:enoyl-[acyl-carrier protein] reductase / trans-2-enoyl-CoA reductase (NAD+) [Clostridium cavendishii DSM 21758]|uniref:Trans-2-enoyl-CoA reductase [NADH] n=1 Tax=Clostridium cavendishii DSM 21758 TaxID=1121302 RepID=A0A1M6B9K7_9CLOT|nr:enoyl-ACP reductase FabV [Clostridium cavendishii]SHI45419.1 enoyl-[acyl-carrier protein] reductase / trans-2-enoyl-CoA reductase (NAD+) [Clostridium cavendishii DSM 21758]
MKIEPKFRGFLCTAAHPVGCAENISEQINYVKSKGKFKGPKNVLVIGASAGYGLASRIVAAFGFGASTIGVSFEKEAVGKRTGTAGYYNTKAFDKFCNEEGIYTKSINGDAYSNEIKEKVIETIKDDLGKVDLIIYSLAAPRRTNPLTGETLSSVLKPIGESFKSKTVDFHTKEVKDVTIEPASEDEIRQTVGVMGGEDWNLWIEALKKADVLAEGVKTIAYSYVGPSITFPIYREGAIGMAKDNLEDTAKELTKKLQNINGEAYVSVNKALVTQASSAIPVVSLYISILYKIMKEKNIHEGCIEQIQRLFEDVLYGDNLKLDEKGRIRIDELEMREDVQNEVNNIWEKVNSQNIEELTDVEGFRKEFLKLFGFGLDNVDYDKDAEV